MRRALKTFGLAILVTSGFAAGAITAGVRDWFQPIAHVVIKNDSGQDLSALNFTHSSGRVKSNVVLPAIKNGQSTEIRFYVAGGEGDYQVEANFADGRVLTGGEDYIESGYSITAVVGTSAIKSQSVLYGF
jgi:hypothetical protein